MADYALLLLPSANRVYTTAARELAAAELAVLTTALALTVTDVRPDTLAGVDYLLFSSPDLDDRAVRPLGNLSAAHAMFEQQAPDRLRPVPMSRLDRYDDDLITILKYPGKTNEQFTKLLLNVTAASCAAGREMVDRPLSVLDPMCGRGTTLNQALMYGWSCAGVDIDRRDFDSYATFLRTWLERKRLKHSLTVESVRRDRHVIARRMHAVTAPTKSEWDNGVKQEVTMFNADTTQVPDLLRRQRFDVVVADLPYGVQHGSRRADAGIARNPTTLLEAALPGWLSVLKPGGAVGLSWNANVAPRSALLDTLSSAGLEVLDSPPYDGFQHRVDNAIVRDLIVAVSRAASPAARTSQ